MNIGDYVKYKKVIWEIIRIDSDLILLSPRQNYSDNQDDIWIEMNKVTKTNLSQLYFEL